jgi:hypothetical protein
MRSASMRMLFPALFAVTLLAATAASGQPLFPEPLHLRRSIDDPISGTTHLVDEYFTGHRMISVSGSRVAIADFARGELTVIDREAMTWSLTPFEKLAAAGSQMKRTSTVARGGEWRSEKLPAVAVAGRTAEVIDSRPAQRGEVSSIRVAFDRNHSLSRPALEVILGVAYPATPARHDEEILRLAGGETVAALGTGGSRQQYSLPLEIVLTFDAAGESLVLRNRVMQVTRDLPPPDLLAIPPGATRVELPAAIIHEQLDALDRLPNVRR